MKNVRKIRGVKTLSWTGSLVFCENCKKILGSINAKGYNYINMQFWCTCGNYGCVEVAKKRFVDISNRINKMPSIRKLNMSCCSKCNTPLFSVSEDRTSNYSFYVECVCGERYDTRGNFDTRLGETLRLFNESKKNA